MVNDPHLDATILPGPWYPIGLFTPEWKAIGANLPGVPGIMVGRTEHLGFGVTNAYGDSQDLYIVDVNENAQDQYLTEQGFSQFEMDQITIEIKDDTAEGGIRNQIIEIRRTDKGPVVSDHPVFGFESDKPVVLRTAGAELTSPSIGFHKFLTAANAEQFNQALHDIDVMYMNYIYADTQGNIWCKISILRI